MIYQVFSERVCLSKEVKGEGAKVQVTVGSNQNEDKQCDRTRIPITSDGNSPWCWCVFQMQDQPVFLMVNL